MTTFAITFLMQLMPMPIPLRKQPTFPPPAQAQAQAQEEWTQPDDIPDEPPKPPGELEWLGGS